MDIKSINNSYRTTEIEVMESRFPITLRGLFCFDYKNLMIVSFIDSSINLIFISV